MFREIPEDLHTVLHAVTRHIGKIRRTEDVFFLRFRTAHHAVGEPSLFVGRQHGHLRHHQMTFRRIRIGIGVVIHKFASAVFRPVGSKIRARCVAFRQKCAGCGKVRILKDHKIGRIFFDLREHIGFPAAREIKGQNGVDFARSFFHFAVNIIVGLGEGEIFLSGKKGTEFLDRHFVIQLILSKQHLITSSESPMQPNTLSLRHLYRYQR